MKSERISKTKQFVVRNFLHSVQEAYDKDVSYGDMKGEYTWERFVEDISDLVKTEKDFLRTPMGEVEYVPQRTEGNRKVMLLRIRLTPKTIMTRMYLETNNE